jgi:hypothetical protein
MDAVIFDPILFKSRYPVFQGISNNLLENNFGIAALLLDNSAYSRVKSPEERRTLLYLMTAHYTQLNNMTGTGGQIGNVASASQGSTSVSFSLPRDMNWFTQTQWGYLFWQLTAKYRLGGFYVKYRGCEAR